MKFAFALAGVAAASQELGPYPGYSGPLKITGHVDAYLATSGNAYVTYTMKGLEDACKTTPDGVSNACGIHIHAGKTCDDADAVGGHYFDSDSIESDPWSPLGYKTGFLGYAHGSVKAAIGEGQDITGRAIVVHDSTVGPVACATLPSTLKLERNNLQPYPGYEGPLKVTGEVKAYLATSGNAYVTYSLSGLEDVCKTTPDGVANACGIHIHEGKTCDDAASVGGHYYDTESLEGDPWSPVGYVTKFGGYASGSGKAAIGHDQDIAGRAIVVHDSTGARVGCSVLPSLLVREGNVQPYPGYSGPLKVTGEVNAYLSKSGNAYLTYSLRGLEDVCKTTPDGVSNACGIHIHAGKTCDDADAIGGHYFDSDAIESDPWSPLGYNTGFAGFAAGSVKAAIGNGQNIAGRAIVVHDSTGARVGCSLLPSTLTLQEAAILI
jgi:hypothetical protein